MKPTPGGKTYPACEEEWGFATHRRQTSRVEAGEVEDPIHSNNGPGIHVRRNSSLATNDRSIHDNKGNGVALALVSSGRFNNLVNRDDNNLWGGRLLGCDGDGDGREHFREPVRCDQWWGASLE